MFAQFSNSALWIIYLIYPLLCFMTIQGFKCESVEDVHFLSADMNEPCPWKKGERGSWIFVWSAISMTIYPVGIPILLLGSLIYLDVPRLARYGMGEAIFQQMIGLYIKQRDRTICSKLAIYVRGRNAQETGVAERAAKIFRQVSDNGKYAVTSDKFLDWMRNEVGIEGCDDEEVLAELEDLFTYFDRNGNGQLDEGEILSLVECLDEASSVVHQGLRLRSVAKKPLSVLSDFEWESLVPGHDAGEHHASGVGLVFLKQLKNKEEKTTGHSSPSSASGSRIGLSLSHLRLHMSSRSWPSQHILDKNQQMERDDMIDALLKRGEAMIKAGIFAVPRLSWHSEENSHPDDEAVLQTLGFLLDAYHKQAWWWEIFEMWRKLMLAGAIILVPTTGGKQIGFAFLISTICLYVTLRASPFAFENLSKLHTMSLTAQSITLFYALLIEVQHLSSSTVCIGRDMSCRQSISDVVMDHVLTLLQVSVFFVPVFMLLKDRGFFAAAVRILGTLGQRTRVWLGCQATALKTRQRWPLEVSSSDESSPPNSRVVGPLSTQQRGLSQPRNSLQSIPHVPAAREHDVTIAVGGAPKSLADDVRACGRGEHQSAATFSAQGTGNTDRDIEWPDQINSSMPGSGHHSNSVCSAEENAIEQHPARDALDAPFNLFPRDLWQPGPAPRPLLSNSEQERDREVQYSRHAGLPIHAQKLNPGVESGAATEDLWPVVGQSFTAHSGSPINAWNDASTIACSFGDILCSNGCQGLDDALATHWCVECDKAICGIIFKFCMYAYSLPRAFAHIAQTLTFQRILFNLIFISYFRHLCIQTHQVPRAQ